ncbi:efflux RND transporter periplasmic adaptor subunit [Marinospirillum alkaliphilum]|uniref:Membrane fusion protein, multidrug efflux system n=1 Tax=Marinospirillum alkaliphilum DSM 21637 TaxID=1122209 RepID=A0A1K1VLD7_9GAMM|nr:efflux RND transporter periplasmic adaptor subunit [Marinospirillum alkaliphilum]SFX25373.1 membrane fusion protein, multidrug efflux system [Marinospirillum alkaliphilum DSM 21637]
MNTRHPSLLLQLWLTGLLLLLPGLSLHAQQGVAVTLTEVRQQTFSQQLHASGTLRAWQSTDLRTQVSGRIVALHLPEGEWVEQGQLLVQLDDREARARLQQAEIHLREAERQLQRFNQLHQNQSISRDQLDAQQANVENARAQLLANQAEVERYRILAPFSGFLGQHQATPGMLLDSGSLITTLDDTRQMRIDFALSERHLPLLHTGLELQARSSSWPEQAFKGQVSFIGTRIDPTTRNLPLQARLDNSAGLLRPGMLVTLTLETASRQALVVPTRSLTFRGQEKAVFVVNEQGIAQRRIVEVGATRGEQAEILSGLKAGEQVVDQGVVKLRDGLRVRAAAPDEQV